MRIVLFANTDWYLYNFRRSLLLALRDRGHDLLLLSPPGPYGDRLRALGLGWEPVPMVRRSLNPFTEAVLLYRLWRLLRRESPGLVHSFTLKCAVYGSLAARMARVPARINAVAGMGYVFTNEGRKARSLRPLVRLLLRVALGGRNSRLILQNPDDVALFERARLVDSSQVRMIRGSGVDCFRFAAEPERSGFDRPQGQLRVLLPARLLWDKGVGEFVEAIRQLRARGLRDTFLLAGDPDPGNPASVPEARIRSWVEEGLVEWLGHVDDMPALFRSVDVVVLPSYREGLPKGLIEAGASGCALVTTDVPGCREVVSDGKDGLLVPARDAPALADAVGRLLADPGLRLRLGNAARQKALSIFDERIIIAATLSTYGELCDSA
jgi:glycosyltransferase involved in cell wall biosynthesis